MTTRMTSSEISTLRLTCQKIARTEYKTAKEIVSWMGAVQAQDYAMAKWAIGVRLLNSSGNKIETSFNKGEIIRTHLMRPTWHFISPDDIYWMLDLTASRIKYSMKSRNKQLELFEAIFTKTNDIIKKALIKRNVMTREEIAKELNNVKIKTDENRLSHLLFQTELDGIVCSGPIKNGKQTYALLAERVPHKKVLTRDESLAELAKRYFTSHGPATIRDFAWWSGLSLADSRQALEFIKSGFISETIGPEKYWMANSFSKPKNNKTSAYLLPAYDEFLISYKDRKSSLSLSDNKKAVSANGFFRPVIVVNGKVTGLWKPMKKNDKVLIQTEFFESPDKTTRNLIEKRVYEFGRFLNKETVLETHPPAELVEKP